MYIEDTIASIATPIGSGGIGIIRISGSSSLEVAERVFNKFQNGGYESHRFYYGRIKNPVTHELLDEGMLVFMKGPRSYTREDVVELHCHGGYLVVQRVLDVCLSAGARLAEPGEFTRRAYLNGRIDLCQAEAVMDLIQSRTDASLAVAQSQREGHLSKLLHDVAGNLRTALAYIEAFIDFPEDDIDISSQELIASALTSCDGVITGLLNTFDEGRVIRDGITVMLAGKPNVGKSSLLNLLLSEQRAIVSHIPGTTRDTIEEVVEIGGLPVRLIDSAGIRTSRDEIEMEGVKRALDKLETADLVLLVVDGSAPLDSADYDIIRTVAGKRCLAVINKSDLPQMISDEDLQLDAGFIHISSRSGSGIDQLRSAVVRTFISGDISTALDHVIITSARHRDILSRAAADLRQCHQQLQAGAAAELLADDVRSCLSAIGEITGSTSSDDILDIIFSSFCIGK